MRWREALGSLARGFLNQPTALILAEATVAMALIGLGDVLTGAELSFSIFYLVPIVLVAWTMSLRWSLTFAAASSIIWLIADDLAGHEYSNRLLPLWNAAIRLGYFVLFAVLFDRQRSFFERERTFSRQDPLTKLHNRRSFEELAGREVDRANRHGRPLSMAFVDLDHFKAVNDTLGHDAGDALLQEVASTLLASLRSTDIVARFGGDEFVLALPETTEPEACTAVDHARQLLLATMREHGWGVTFSIGVTSTAGSEGAADLTELLAAADALAYQAKRAGRDRIAVAGPTA